MAKLFQTICSSVVKEKYVIGLHASERLEERGIMEWQVVDGLEEGALLFERPKDRPNPSVVVQQRLPDGTSIRTVWSLLRDNKAAKLVTVHFIDG